MQRIFKRSTPIDVDPENRGDGRVHCSKCQQRMCYCLERRDSGWDEKHTVEYVFDNPIEELMFRAGYSVEEINEMNKV